MSNSSREPVVSAYLLWGDPVTDGIANLGEMHFDAVISEKHTRTTEITQHSVEQGAKIADHVRANTDHLVLEVLVSNVPIKDGPNRVMFPHVIDVPGFTPQFPEDMTATVPPAPVELSFVGLLTLLSNKLPQTIHRTAPPRDRQSGPQFVSANTLMFDGETDFVRAAYDALTRLRDSATLIEIVTPRQSYASMVIASIEMSRDKHTGTSGNFTLEFQQIRTVSSKVVQAPLPSIPRADTGDAAAGKKDPKKAPVQLQSLAVTAGHATNTIDPGYHQGITP
jgi:hypothetical protein